VVSHKLEDRIPGSHPFARLGKRIYQDQLVKRLDPRILPDMSARVAFLTRELTAEERSPHLAIRAAAVVSGGADKLVYVVRDGKVQRVAVQTGRTIGDLVELVRGPQAGESVVLHPPPNLRDGMSVRLLKK
jgi:multidrug efflux pump subunit AcrA (membrane-fusion protein)